MRVVYYEEGEEEKSCAFWKNINKLETQCIFKPLRSVLPSSSHADEDSDKARSKQCLVCTTGICFPHDDSEGRNEIPPLGLLLDSNAI